MKLRHADGSLGDILRTHIGGTLNAQPEAPTWLHEVGDTLRQDLGVLALNGVKGLSEQLQQRDVRVPLSSADDLVLLLALGATEERRRLGIAVPPGAIMLPMLVVCKLLLGDLLATAQALDGTPYDSFRERGGVLLVSPDAELRARYFNMRVGAERVIETYPACRMRPDGSVASVLASQDNASDYSVCFFLASQKKLPDPAAIAFTPSIVLLDLTRDHWVDRLYEVVGWCAALRNKRDEPAALVALIPFGDNLSREALDKHGISIFPLDCAGIDELVQAFPHVPSSDDKDEVDILRSWSLGSCAIDKPLERTHTILYVPEEASSDILQTVTDIHAMLDASSDRRIQRELRLAWWLVGTLTQLPIPVQWYEQHAYLMGNRQTIKKLITGIGNSGGGTLSADFAPLLQSLRGQLDLLYTRLTAVNPKNEAFLAYYREQIYPLTSQGKTTALVVRNDVVARALWPWLQSEGVPVDDERVRVLSYKQLDGRDLFDHMLVLAWWPSRYRWQLGGRLARNLDFLLYRGEETILERQLGYFYSLRYRQSCERRRFATMHTLGAIQVHPAADTQLLEPYSALSLFTPQGPMDEPTPTAALGEPPDNAELELRSLFTITTIDPGSLTPVVQAAQREVGRAAIIYPMSGTIDEQSEEESVDVEAGEAVVGPTDRCVLLTLQLSSGTSEHVQQLGYLYLEDDEATDCYVPGQTDVTRTANDEVQPGYILIRTDQDDRRSLFDRVVELADAQPTMKYLKVWREYWLEAIDSLVQKHASGGPKHGAYTGLRQRLVEAGVTVTTATVRDWVLGERIGPENIAAVEAVGRLADHQQLQRHPQQVDAAFRQIRTIHQVLGRRIGTTIQSLGAVQQTSGKKASKKEVFLDPALSLPIDDLLDLLQFWRVERVDVGPFNVPVNRIGKVLPRAAYGMTDG